MNSRKKYFIYPLTLIIISLFIIVGCSDDDPEPEPTYDLILEVHPAGAGNVTGAGEYQEGEQVNISASAEEGWFFLVWNGDTEEVDDPFSPNTSLTMPSQNLNLTARFLQDPIYGDGVTDIDGNQYLTVIIGDQEWMAENLKVTRDAAGNDISRFCYNDDTDNCDLYGGLYTWHTVMNQENSSKENPSGVQGICPEGWHVPSDDEWTELVNYLHTQGFPNSNTSHGAGNALKSCRQVNSPLGGDCDTSEHPRWNSHHIHYGFDAFGFSAQPGGGRGHSGGFFYLGDVGYWWSSTQGPDDTAWFRSMAPKDGNVFHNIFWVLGGYSVRCVRDLDD